MGKVLIIKGVDFSENAIGSIDYELPEGGESSGTPSVTPPSNRLTILYSPVYMNVSVGAAQVARRPMILYAPSTADYDKYRVVAVDVSECVGRTIKIKHTMSGEKGYGFLSDTSELGNRDLANIEAFSGSMMDTYYGFKAFFYGDCSLGYGDFEEDGENYLVVPANAKWLIFGVEDPSKSATVVTV